MWSVGDGKERSLLERFANEHGLREVLFLGWQDNPYPFKKHMDYLLGASTTESYGLVVREAYILGTPSISAGYRCLISVLFPGVHCWSGRAKMGCIPVWSLL